MTLYQEIRAAGKSMHGKALQATRHQDFHPLRIAKRMTLPLSGRTLVFDDEVVQNAFFDFWFNEYRVNGKSLADSVDPVAAGLEPLEAEMLQTHRQARTSFFLIEAERPGENQIRLRDLLEPDRSDVLLTDMGLSASIRRLRLSLALFCRVLAARDIAMTSGFSFAFDPARVPGLLDAYRKKTKKVPAADLSETRFVFFFQKYRQFGVAQEYQNVV
ncbi:MAG: hypothetical protein HY674_22915 [Chloroflexi bacterium]|nr:hypothetical protein [Chloroflexota bacterium]